jgi:23S rRNA pseudouridine955/2504/2580 synthase
MPKAQFVTVTQAESGQKLLQFLERRLRGDVPRSALQRWIRKGQVRVDKGRKKPFDRIEAGQVVRIPPYAPGEENAPKSGGKLTIVHEDSDILAIAKPAGLAVHGGDGIDDSVAGRLAVLYPDAEFRPTLAHRLDRHTSGLLLAAKNYAALRRLNDAFASGGVDKLYLAWVRGAWTGPDRALLSDRIEKRGEPGAQAVRTGSGKTALAEVTALIVDRDYSLVAVKLLTGRTHQIRVQLASRGHPVVGDRKYGKGRERGPMRLHCHALRVDGTVITLAPDWKGRWAVPEQAPGRTRELLGA